jgi:hypothetical protein
VLWNDGRGNFPRHTHLNHQGSVGPVVVGDFNGDTFSDIGFANVNTIRDRLEFWLGLGAGEFEHSAEEHVPERPLTFDVSMMLASDLDDDGDLDIVSDGPVLLNDGSGFFGRASIAPRRTAVFDANGDGVMEIIGSSGGTVEIRALDDAGSYESTGHSHYSNFRFGPAVSSDFNRDGRADFVLVGFGQGYTDLNRFDFYLSEPYSPLDCDGNGVLDSCESMIDCDEDGKNDACEIATGSIRDCNRNSVGDLCEIRSRDSEDCNGNSIPDECEIALLDCNGNGIADVCGSDIDLDCDGTRAPDKCDLKLGRSFDFNDNQIPDECDGDCDRDGVQDAVEIAEGTPDCDGNGMPDACDIANSFAFNRSITLTGLLEEGIGHLSVADLDGEGRA